MDRVQGLLQRRVCSHLPKLRQEDSPKNQHPLAKPGGDLAKPSGDLPSLRDDLSRVGGDLASPSDAQRNPEDDLLNMGDDPAKPSDDLPNLGDDPAKPGGDLAKRSDDLANLGDDPRNPAANRRNCLIIRPIWNSSPAQKPVILSLLPRRRLQQPLRVPPAKAHAEDPTSKPAACVDGAPVGGASTNAKFRSINLSCFPIGAHWKPRSR